MRLTVPPYYFTTWGSRCFALFDLEQVCYHGLHAGFPVEILLVEMVMMSETGNLLSEERTASESSLIGLHRSG
jgi:hypothetical protein